MAQENGGSPAPVKELPQSIRESLIQSAKDRAALDALLVPLFRHLWTDFLDILYELLPHEPNDGSENARAYQRYRHRVLNLGNRKAREVPNITRDFITWQVYERTVVTNQVIKGHGLWNLPPNVKMPSERASDADDRK